MSLTLENAEQKIFDSMVKAEYYSKGFRLRGTTRVRTGVNGKTCDFRKMGIIVATETGWQQTVTIQDPNFQKVTCTLKKWTAPCATDEIQDLTVNFSTKSELARTVAQAIARRADQITIDALELGVTGPNTIANGGTNMSFSKLREVLEKLEDNAVPVENRYITLSGNNLRALLASDQITSRFYTSNDNLVDGQLNYKDILGINVRTIPTMTEGGMTKTTNIRECMVWHTDAIGTATGQDLRTEINYMAREMSWLINGVLFSGCVAIDNRGIFKIEALETVNP